MSACNAFVSPSTIYIVTDGAGGRRGRFMHYVNKQFVLPHMCAVVSGRGTAAVLRRVWEYLEQNYATLDEMLIGIERGDLKRRFGAAAKLLPKTCGFQLCVTAFSEHQANPIAFVYLSTPSGSKFPAWQRLDIGSFFAAPDDPAVLKIAERIARGPKGNVDLVEGFRKLIDAQRRLPAPTTNPDFLVGGFCQVTTISRASMSITTRILARWDEAVGQPIDAERQPSSY